MWGDTQMAPGNSFILGGDFWSPWKAAGGGAVACTAKLFYFSNTDAVVELGATQFNVG